MNEPELPRILCVDDEPNLLAALERTLYGQFDVVTATGGEAGLTVMEQSPGFDVIVSDMRMPGMDGATFLALARERAPDTVRILLTGQADMDSAVAAINRGAIFHFLRKPCPSTEVVATLHKAVELRQRIRVERELLETTLAATIKMLTEVLSMIAPWAFQRAGMLQACVRHVVNKLEWPNRWEVEAAAALSHIGCVSVPGDVMQREFADEALTEEEQVLLDAHPEVAHRLLLSIPRMQNVAEIVRYQSRPAPHEASDDVIRGAQLLRASLHMVRCLSRKESVAHAVQALKALQPPVAHDIVNALIDLRMNVVSGTRKARIRELVPGWRAEQDILTNRGLMLLAQGSELTATAIVSMRNLLATGAINEPILISYGSESELFSESETGDN